MKKTGWLYTLLTVFLVVSVILPNIIYTFTPTETLQKQIQSAAKRAGDALPVEPSAEPQPAELLEPETVSSTAGPVLNPSYGSVFDRPSTQLQTSYPTKGQILFAPSIDLDSDPTTNPVNSSPVPVVEILGQQGGIIELAVQLDAHERLEDTVDVPVTFQLHNSKNELVFDQTLTTDTWGAVKAQIPVEDINESYSYKAIALGFGQTEVRRFHFNPDLVSAKLYEDGATLEVTENADRWYVFTLTSPRPLDADRDSAELTIMRRPTVETLDELKNELRAVIEDVDSQVDELPPLSMPTVVMEIVSATTAQARIQLPEGDYGFVALLEVNDTVNEYFHSEAVRLTVEDSPAAVADTIYWASEIDYEPGMRLVIRENELGRVSFDLVATEQLPAIIEEHYTAPKEFVNLVRTGPFQWREERYDIEVNTLVDDGKKTITLHDFNYDPLQRRYTIAIESLQDTVITDTMRIDVFGPGDKVLMHEDRTVVLKPGDILYYDINVPTHLGEPERLRVGLDDPILEDLRSVIDAARTIASTAEIDVTKLYIKAYADVLRQNLIEVKYDFVSGETEWKTPLWDNLRQHPFRTLVEMAEAAGEDITIFKIRWGSLLWDVITGKYFGQNKEGLLKLLSDVIVGLQIRLGGLTVAVGADVSFSLTADPTMHCPDPEDIAAVKDNLQQLALLLDSQVAGDAFSVNTKPKWKIPILGWLAISVGQFGARAGTGFDYKPDFTIVMEGEVEFTLGANVVLNPLSIFDLLLEVISFFGSDDTTQEFMNKNGDKLKTVGWFALAKFLLQGATTIKRWNFYYNMVKNVLDQISIYGDCDPDPPDPRPPDDRQDVWQGVENFYEGETHAQTINNLSELIQRAKQLGLPRAELLLTMRLRQAELVRFQDDNEAYVDYVADTFGAYAGSDFEILEVITQTVVLTSTDAISESIFARLEERDEELANLPYVIEQERLENALAVAEEQFLALQGQDLELQHELRQLFTADTLGILASGFAEATQSAASAMGLPHQLVSPWPGSSEFRGQPAPYLAPGLAPRVMVIPSGGLHAISLSTEARDWLDAYVSGGGLLIVFSQAFGEDWTALPGGEVDGVGYEEDRRWQHATVEATQPSDWLVWMGIPKPDIQVDGAFTAWPSDANVLLKRTFGDYAGYPVLLEYGHGEGTVLATSAYGDWAWQTNFWWGDDARFTHSILIRGYLLARGQDVNDVYAGDPASSVAVTFPLSNTASVTTTQVRLQIPLVWGSGSNSSVATVPAAIGPGDGAELSATIPTPPTRRGVHDWTQVGLYRARMTVSTTSGNYEVWGPFVYVRSPVNPPALSGSLQVEQSPVSLFGTAVLTASVRNFTGAERTVVLSPTNDLPTDTITLTVPANSTASHVYTLFMDGSKAPSVEFYDETAELISRANMSVQVAYPNLQATPLIPAAMADGATIPVVVTNKAGQGQALSATLAMTLTEPSGAAVWTATQPLPAIAAGDTTTPTFTISLPDTELGTYQLVYRVDDGRNLARTSSTPIPSSLVLDTNFDRGSYRIRETGVLTVELSNSGRFDLNPVLSVSAPDIGLNDTQPTPLPVGNGQSYVYPFTIPDTLDNGEYEAVISYQVGGQTLTRTLSIQIPQSRVIASMEQTAYAAGDDAVITLSNSGGVDALVTGTMYLVDIYGSTIATDTIAVDVLAGQGTTVTLAIPAGAIEGDYYIELIGQNNESGAEVNLARHLDISGVTADLTVYTGEDDYFSDEEIATFADILLGSGGINGGDLSLRICSANADDGGASTLPPVVNYDYETVPFNWIDIASGGQLVAQGWDTYEYVEIGFPFEFYGITYTEMYVGSNGYITFGNGHYSGYNEAIPSIYEPNNAIYGLWTQLYPIGGDYGSIYFDQVDPDRVVVQWEEVMHCCDTSSPETFQIVLDGSDNSITLQYLDVTNPYSATVGVEDFTGSSAVQISYNQPGIIVDNSAFRLTTTQVQVPETTYESTAATFDWIDIASGGTPVARNTNTYQLVDLGFPFQFYGITYTQMYVGSNGYVSFGNGNTTNFNQPIPSPGTPNNTIYAFWDYLFPIGGDYGSIYVSQTGPEEYVVQWEGVAHCCSLGSPETFQIVLDGSDDSITLQYLDISSAGSATVGVENSNGSEGLQISYNQTGIITDGAAFRLTPASVPVQQLNYVDSPATLDWTDISGTGSIVAQGDDTYSFVNIGFPFQFYGITYTQMYVGSNGYVSFGSGYTPYSNSDIPSTGTPNNAIYAFWDDLYPGGGIYGNIYSEQISPTMHIIQWNNVAHCCSTSSPETFQVILDGTDHSVTLQYLDMTSTGSATVGVENATGSLANRIAYNQSGIITDGSAFRLELITETIQVVNYMSTTVPISWTNVAPEPGTQIVALGTNTYEWVELGFPFEFYGITHTEMYVGSNGYVSFGDGYWDDFNTPIPELFTPNNAIYGFWDFLYPIGGSDGAIYTRQVSPTLYVVQWEGVDHCCPAGSPETFQIVLDGSDNSITLQYEEVSDPSSATVGVENAFGTVATQLSFEQTDVITDSVAFRLTTTTELVTRTTYLTASVPISWTEVAPADGTQIVAVGSNTYEEVPLGFSFDFYGQDYTEVFVGSNGYVSFGQGNTSSSNSAIPSFANPNNAIYALWDSLYPLGGEYGSIYTRRIDPNRFVIQWDGVAHCCSTTYTETFQIILDNSDDTITLQYEDTALTSSATVGVENEFGGSATQIVYNQSGVIVDNTAYRLTPDVEEQPPPPICDPTQPLPLEVVLVIDRSGSMSGSPIVAAKNAAVSFVGFMDLIIDRAALVSFQSSATLNQTLTQDENALVTAINSLVATGGTRIDLGLQVAHQELINNGDPAATPVIVLLSDGVSSGDPIGIASAIKAAGIRIISIGLGSGADANTLRAIASTPDDYYFAPSSVDLEEIFESIGNAICRSPLPYDLSCGGYVLWETTIPVTATTTFNASEIVDPLDVSGRMTLDGRVFAETGQPVAQDQYPFYLHDRDTALTLETDKLTYFTGETIFASGRVTNTSALTLTTDLEVWADEQLLIDQPLTLAPGEGYSYTTTLTDTAAMTNTLVTFVAIADGLSVYRPALVGTPTLAGELTAPPVVSRDPFSATLIISNSSQIAADLQLAIEGQSPTAVTLNPGNGAALDATVQTLVDATLSGTISGDVSQTLTTTVIQGELAQITLLPPASNLAGPIEIPYQIDGTGLLEADGVFTLEANSQVVGTQVFAVQPGETVNGTIVVNLPAGKYTLTGQISDQYGLFDSDTLDIALLAPAEPAIANITDISISVPPTSPAGGTVEVTVEVTNDGAEAPIIIGVQLFGPEEQIIVTPAAYDTSEYTFELPIPADMPADDYFGEAVVDGQTVPFTVAVTGIDVEMSLALDQTYYNPGEVATLTVTLTDLAGVTADYLVMPRYLTAEDYYTVTIPANTTVQYTFPFTATVSDRVNVFLATTGAPPDYERRVLTLDSLPVQVLSPERGATVVFDKLVYDPGETVHVTVNVTGTLSNLFVMGPMERTINNDDILVWNGPSDPDALLTFILTGTYNLSTTLPTTMKEGRYTFLVGIDSEIYTYPIDVRGYKVTTRHFEVDKPQYNQQDTITAVAEFWNEGDAPINGLQLEAWIITPDGNGVLPLTPVVSRTVDLAVGLNVISVTGQFDTPDVGPHRILLNLKVPGQTWRVAGAVGQFNVGWASLIELNTDKGNYVVNETATGRLDVYGFGPTELTVTVANDGSTVFSQTVELDGFRTFSFTVPTTAADDYLLVANSVDQSGNEDELTFVYGVPAPADFQPPQIVFNLPFTHTILTTSAPTTTFPISGTVTDNEDGTVVIINGEIYTPTAGGGLSADVEVFQGYNAIVVTVVDEAGNHTSTPTAIVQLVPEHEVVLTADDDEVLVGEDITFNFVLSATGAISDVYAYQILPDNLVADVSVLSPTYGLAEVITDTGFSAVTWYGAITEPVTVTVIATAINEGVLTQEVDAYWASGLVETSNQVTVNLVTDQEPPSPDTWENGCGPSDLAVEIIGVGMGSPDLIHNPATLTISDPGSVDYILAQVVVNDYSQALPDEVTLTTDVNSHSLVTPTNTAAGYSYEMILPPTSQVTAEVVGDYDGYEYTPRAFILYVFREQGGQSNNGRLVHQYIYHSSHSETLTVPAASFTRDIVVTFAVADVDRDDRTFIVSATAGGVTREAELQQANQGDSLALYELILPDVPGAVTEVTASVTSPTIWGDSVYWSGVQAAAACEEVVIPGTRVVDGLQALYTFQEGSGSTVADVSGVGTPLDLTIANTSAVSWLPGGGLSVNSSTVIASTVSATKLITTAQTTNELTLEAWILPVNVNQDGPARIVTLSEDTGPRNFTLAQGLWGSYSKDLFDVRLRATATDDNGLPSLTTPAGTAQPALQHVVFTRDSAGVTHIYVNGVEVANGTVGGDFSNWATDYMFALANEITGERPWLGQFHLVAVYNQALDLTQVRQNYLAGSGTTP